MAATRDGNAECQLAFDATRVYWPAYPGQDAVQAAPLDGGGPIATLGAVSSRPAGLALDAKAIYWIDRSDGTVMKVAR